MVTVSTTGFGVPAITELGRILHERRGGDPLAPALVVCAKPLVAIGVRRALGRRPGGIAATNVTTIDRLVEDLAAPGLASLGARPASDIELHAGIRAELTRRPGRFGPVAGHRTTEERLVRLHHQVAGIGPDALDRVGKTAGGLAADAIRVIRAAEVASGPALGEGALIELALTRLAATAEGELGPIVVYLPDPTRPFEGRVVAALANRSDCDIVVGLTGDPTIDARQRARLARWNVRIGGSSEGERPLGTLTEVADPGDEVRAALGELMAHAALGQPLDGMAVLYSTADPYLSLLAEQLDAAGLPWCGPGARPLASSVSGRFLIRVLGLVTTGLERSAFVTLLDTGPLAITPPADGAEAGGEARAVGGGPAAAAVRLVPARRWDRLSRQAGVVDDSQWEPRLAELGRNAEAHDRDEIAELIGFVGELRRRLRPDPVPVTWREWVDWARGLLDRYLVSVRSWPAEEQQAHQSVCRTLERLAILDDYEAGPDLATVESIITTELAHRAMPGRPLGRGLLVAPITAVAGLGFDRVVVIGLAEGVFPRTPREDSLLTDTARAEADGQLAATEIVTELDIQAVASAVCGATHPPLLVAARGDLRSTRSRTWPRVLDSLVGERSVIESHHRLLRDHGRPSSRQDLGLRSLIAAVDRGERAADHGLAAADHTLAANLNWSGARQASAVNRHLGLVPAGTIDPTERLLSATALEDYAACPRRYLFGRVLRLGEHDRPERIDEITPLDRGTLVHAVLEDFVAEMLSAGTVPGPGQPWSPAQRLRLMAILDDRLERARTTGVTGGRVNTTILRRRLRNEMQGFLQVDDELRAQRRSTPLHVEFAFGMEDEPSNVSLPDGRSMQLRGLVDRVDATEDGGVLVIDYKGGSGRAYNGLAADPLDGGRRLQLPLYARVVAEKLGRSGPRTALYWLTGISEVRPVELEDELEEELDVLVGAALDGISTGLFPGVPGDTVGWPRLTFDNCKYCDFDRICPTDRQREWETVRSDDALEPVSVLLLERDR